MLVLAVLATEQEWFSTPSSHASQRSTGLVSQQDSGRLKGAVDRELGGEYIRHFPKFSGISVIFRNFVENLPS